MTKTAIYRAQNSPRTVRIEKVTALDAAALRYTAVYNAHYVTGVSTMKVFDGIVLSYRAGVHSTVHDAWLAVCAYSKLEAQGDF